MSSLRANIEELDEAIKVLCEILPQFDDLRYNVNDIASELYSTWDGDASRYFVSKLRSHITPLRNAQTALEYFKEYAEETKQNMKEADKAIDAITVDRWRIVPTTTSNSSSQSVNNGSSQPAKNNSKTNSSANTVAKVVNAITKSINQIVNGIKVVIGGAKK